MIPGITRVLRRPFACQPCYRRECPLGHHRCMSEITVDEVFHAAVGLYSELDARVEVEERRSLL